MNTKLRLGDDQFKALFVSREQATKIPTATYLDDEDIYGDKSALWMFPNVNLILYKSVSGSVILRGNYHDETTLSEDMTAEQIQAFFDAHRQEIKLYEPNFDFDGCDE